MRYYFPILAVLLMAFSCRQQSKKQDTLSLMPQNGTQIKSGETVKVVLQHIDSSFDSIQYYLDTLKLATRTDSSAVELATETCSLGSRLLTARLFSGGTQMQELSSNIELVSSRVPDQYSFEIVNKYAHDTSSYTEGLEFIDGGFYESDGEYGASSIRKTTLQGKVSQLKNFDAKYFAEGITVIGDQILMLTYKERVMLLLDKNTFEVKKTLPYNHAAEGWGLTNDGHTIYNTDGSNRIFKLNKDTFRPEGYLEVYDDKGPVESLNELEWIDGKLYANIYTSDLIAIIDPLTGAVEGYANLLGIRKDDVIDDTQDVLNGIAWDSLGKRLFVTGKKWPKMYEIKLVKR